MHQQTLAYIRKFIRGERFLTFTCNPKWPEIWNKHFQNKKSKDRYDIIVRVLHKKQKISSGFSNKEESSVRLMPGWKWLNCKKRGLPHFHKLKTRGEDIVKILSVELTDKDDDPEVFEIINNQLIHDPRGVINPDSPCL